MATTVFATVTVTATAPTPPPTTVFVTAPCTDHPVVVTATATYTAPKPPEEYPLYLFSPFLADVQPTVTLQVSGPGPTKTSRAKVEPFPHGAAPDTPDPLGVHNLPWYYGPGPSVLLNLAAIIAILQLHLGPPGYRTSTLPADHNPQGAYPEKFILPLFKTRLSLPLPKLPFRIRLLSRLPPLLYISILTTLFGMNLSAYHLLSSYTTLMQLFLTSSPLSTWTPHSGAMGPPFTLLTWGFLFSSWRIILYLHRIQPAKPSPSRYRPSTTSSFPTNPIEAAQRRAAAHSAAVNAANAKKLDYATRIAPHLRLLALEGLGITLPICALAMVVFNKWAWLGGTTVEGKGGNLIPGDFLPGLYWDGMGASGHSLLMLGITCLALMTLVGVALGLLGMNVELWVWCHEWVEKRVCRSPAWKLWLGYCAVLLAATGFMVLILLCMFVGVGTDSFEAWLDRHSEGVKMFWLWMLAPWVLLVFPFFVGPFLMCFPFVILWYLLRGWLFGVLNVRKSSFFIPYTETSVWEREQLVMVAVGLGLLFYSVRQMRHAFIASSRPTGPTARRR